MKSLIIWLGKKYIISGVNDILESKKNDVATLCQTIEVWIKRLQIFIEELKRIMERLSDANVSDDDIKASVKEIEQIVKEWK